MEKTSRVGVKCSLWFILKDVAFFQCFFPYFILSLFFYHLCLSLSYCKCPLQYLFPWTHGAFCAPENHPFLYCSGANLSPPFPFTSFLCPPSGVMCDQQFPANPDWADSADSSTSTACRAPHGAASPQPAPRGESTRKVKWPPGKGWGKSFWKNIDQIVAISNRLCKVSVRCLLVRQILTGRASCTALAVLNSQSTTLPKNRVSP